MFINEVSKKTRLTKKAIEYYVEQGLISPTILENGYRDFNEIDVECLEKISILRKLGISTEEIKVVLNDEKGNVFQKLSIQKELNIQREQAKKSILDKLSCGKTYEDIVGELLTIEQSETITEKLLEMFPGYYGQFICLHFARFLNEPITTAEQQTAYKEIVSFLDRVPAINLPDDLQEYLTEGTKHISPQNITDMSENLSTTYQNFDKFLSENKEILEEYFTFKQSDEYKNSPFCKIQSLLKDFNSTSGYYDVFIPMMKILSTSYANYYSQMELANEKLLLQYPDIAKLNN